MHVLQLSTELLHVAIEKGTWTKQAVELAYSPSTLPHKHLIGGKLDAVFTYSFSSSIYWLENGGVGVCGLGLLLSFSGLVPDRQ